MIAIFTKITLHVAIYSYVHISMQVHAHIYVHNVQNLLAVFSVCNVAS